MTIRENAFNSHLDAKTFQVCFGKCWLGDLWVDTNNYIFLVSGARSIREGADI